MASNRYSIFRIFDYKKQSCQLPGGSSLALKNPILSENLKEKTRIGETILVSVTLPGNFTSIFMEDKIWYLKEINILKNLSEAQRMKLGSLCSMTNFKQGELIYLPGDFKNIYFLKFGSIKLIKLKKEGTEIIKDVLEKGEIFGKCFGGENEELSEEAVVLEDSMVCYLSYENWQEFLKENLDLNLSILKWAGLRIKRLERRMETLYFKPTTERIKDTLLDLAKRFGKKDTFSGNITIPIHLTHEELGQLTGCSRQNVTTVLNEMREKDYIDYTRNKLIIKRAIEEFIIH